MQAKSVFLKVFYDVILVGAALTFLSAIAIYVLHKVRFSAITGSKEKYDYLLTKETKTYRLVWYLLAVTFGLLVNLYGMDSSNLSDVGVWFFVRFFFGIAAATIIGYVAHLVIEYYFPTILNHRLNKWRYMPRKNPKTGRAMRLLTEEQEDVHLEAGMQAEENIFSMDYDVWIDDQTNDVQIEKYPGYLTALRCNNCTFHTMKVTREEILSTREDGTPLELLRHYQCSYCKSVRATQFNVSIKEAGDYKNTQKKGIRLVHGLEMVRVEIVTAVEGRRSWEFQTLEQASKFISEFGAQS